MTKEYLNTVGQSVDRRDGLGHVTGRTEYVDDIAIPHMLHLKMVRSPLPHARIKGIDFSEAEKETIMVWEAGYNCTTINRGILPLKFYLLLVGEGS